MPRIALVLALAGLVLAGCQNHQHDPYSQEYKVSETYSVEFPYNPPPHPEYHSYQDHGGHRYLQPGLNASHGGYGGYGVLYVED